MLLPHLCHLVLYSAAELLVQRNVKVHINILTFSWLIKFSLSYLSSVVCFCVNDSYPEFSRSFPFPFQGLRGFSEGLLRLLGSFPYSFYSTVSARLSLAPCFSGCLPACSL